MISAILGQLVESTATPVGILIAVNGALSLGLGAIYRDCRRDREKLWAHIRELERRIKG